jgi:asparagine synthase (glutamine-hydrolysing)
MCGITGFIAKDPASNLNHLSQEANKVQHRGPDRSTTTIVGAESDRKVRLDFHRLCVNGLNEESDQPLVAGDWYLICNGEIYNYRQLAETYPIVSSSDCEVLAQMLACGQSVKQTAIAADGVFAFFGVNPSEKRIVVARDLFGVRGLYYGWNDDVVGFASEMKALSICHTVKAFPPNTWLELDYSGSDMVWNWGTYWRPFQMNTYRTLFTDEDRAVRACQNMLRAAVRKRMMSDRLPIGCFLSGGLDSSLIAALLVEELPQPSDLHTFSIGMEGSTDLSYADEVANFLGTTHHRVIVTEKEMLDAIPNALRHMETWDTTTVRAGTGMYLLSRWIATHSEVRVIFSGEGADELSGSYLYFRNAPTPEDYQEECLRLCRDLHRYDVLRADQSTAAAGLEVRVPFLDRDFVNIYLRIDPRLRCPRPVENRKIEKYLLRKAFSPCLPPSVAWRVKEAFSDGVSSQTNSWHHIIQNHVKQKIVDIVDNEDAPVPLTEEARWYRQLFQSFYPGRDHVIPYYWLPKWVGSGITDPSARVLDTYG